MLLVMCRGLGWLWWIYVVVEDAAPTSLPCEGGGG